MGFQAGSFIEGLNSGLSLGERFASASEKGRTKRELEAVSSATPQESTGYTAEDGQYLEGLASARDPNGTPYYKVAADESGNYVVQANREAQGFGLSDYQGGTDSTTVSQRKVTDYLGDRTAGGLSDADISKKKGLAMADVVSRTDPEKGSRMRREVTQNEREDQRYAREQKTWEQQDQAAAAETDFKKAYRDAYKGTTYAKRMSEYAPQAEAYKQALAEREAALKAGASPESLGPAPQEPEKPGYSVAESLADHGALLDMRIKAGKADPSEVTRYAESLKKVQEEGYVKALQLGQSGASLDTIANAFNQSGSVKFDPRTVVSDEMVTGDDGVKTRVIKVKDPKTGQVQTIDTLGELDSLGKAASYYDRFYKAQSASAKDKPPSGYRWTAGGGLEPIPGGPATKPASDGAPSGYRYKPDGSLEAIPGGPGDKTQSLKALPTSAAGGLISNVQNLRRAEDALALVSGKNLEGGAVGDTQATGLKNLLPNQLLNRMDPKGVDARAAISDLGSLVIHDRSGAAVTAAEFPRLAPFIPSATDDPVTAKKKLAQFVQNYRATVEDTAEFYRASGYNVPTETLRTTNAVKPGGSTAADLRLPRVSSTADAAKLPSGTVFIDPNGVKRKVP